MTGEQVRSLKKTVMYYSDILVVELRPTMKHVSEDPPEIRTVDYRTQVKAGIAWEGVADRHAGFILLRVEIHFCSVCTKQINKPSYSQAIQASGN
jgi:hypothetical protein